MRPVVLEHRGSPSRVRDSEPRHICIVTETYPPEVNGVAFTLARLAEGLRGQGYTVSLVRPRQQESDNNGQLANSQVTLVRSLPLPGYQGLRIGLPARRALLRRWLEKRPDAVYVATEGPLGLSAVRLARRMGIPVFSGFHTNFHTYLRHYHAKWLQPAVLAYLRWFHNRTTGTIVACAELASELDRIGVNNIEILGRGVDSQRFSPERRSDELRREWRVAADELVVLYVGRIAAEKNLNLAVDGYRAMQRQGNAAHFVLVGDGPQRAALQAQHPDLLFAGVKTGDQLARYCASADIFLFPSETETFGNVTLEAMASGLAVVAYDYAAAHRHICQGVNGVTVPCGDPAAFVSAAVRLAAASDNLPSLRRAARAHAATLDWRHVTQRFATLLLDGDRRATSETDLPARMAEAPVL